MFEDVVKKLNKVNKTISTMESCTGGGLANEITNIPGSSNIFNFGAVTYSNGFKEELGVSNEVIDKYSVYSKQTAHEMALKITKYTNSNYGVGITGKLNKKDPFNDFGNDNEVFVCIYDRDLDKYYDLDIFVTKDTRAENKKEVLEKIKDKLMKIIKD